MHGGTLHLSTFRSAARDLFPWGLEVPRWQWQQREALGLRLAAGWLVLLLLCD